MRMKYHIAYEPYHGVYRWLVRSVNPKDTRESIKRRKAFMICRSPEAAIERLRARAASMRSL